MLSIGMHSLASVPKFPTARDTSSLDATKRVLRWSAPGFSKCSFGSRAVLELGAIAGASSPASYRTRPSTDAATAADEALKLEARRLLGALERDDNIFVSDIHRCVTNAPSYGDGKIC